MKKILRLIYVFAILGLQMLGNISAMYPILEEELINKRNLVTKADILDALALGRCGPGAAVVNTIVFLGNKINGFIGGFIAIISFIIFPFIIIIIISLVIDKFINNYIVLSAFKAISVALFVKILQSIIDLAKNTIINKLTLVIFCISLILLISTNISSIILIMFSIILGILLTCKK